MRVNILKFADLQPRWLRVISAVRPLLSTGDPVLPTNFHAGAAALVTVSLSPVEVSR